MYRKDEDQNAGGKGPGFKRTALQREKSVEKKKTQRLIGEERGTYRETGREESKTAVSLEKNAKGERQENKQRLEQEGGPLTRFKKTTKWRKEFSYWVVVKPPKRTL